MERGEERGEIDGEVAEDGGGVQCGRRTFGRGLLARAVDGDGFEFGVDEPDELDAGAEVEVDLVEDAAGIVVGGEDLDCEIRRGLDGAASAGLAISRDPGHQCHIQIGQVGALLCPVRVAKLSGNNSFAGVVEVVCNKLVNPANKPAVVPGWSHLRDDLPAGKLAGWLRFGQGDELVEGQPCLRAHGSSIAF